MTKFIMLIGLPAVGKDTWAEKYIQEHSNTVIHSSDDIRAELYGNAAHQGSPAKVFEIMRARTIRDLRTGKDVIYNATNVKWRDRYSILSQVKHVKDVECICKIFVAPVEVCKERNAARERSVPDFVYDRMLQGFQTPLYKEGFNNIEIVYTWDGDKLEYMKDIIMKVNAFGDQKNPHHTLSLWDHCVKCGENAFNKYGNETLTLAATIHDYGKIYTKSFDENGIAHYYSHENFSSYLALNMGCSLEVAQLVNYHMLCYNYKGGEAIWRARLGEELWKKIELLHDCDILAH